MASGIDSAPWIMAIVATTGATLGALFKLITQVGCRFSCHCCGAARCIDMECPPIQEGGDESVYQTPSQSPVGSNSASPALRTRKVSTDCDHCHSHQL